jgi:ABC-2 type transport system permease protein
MEMTVNPMLQRVDEKEGLRGFANLKQKENRNWRGTRRWWVNLLLWTVLLCGLSAVMLFAPNDEVSQASQTDIAQAGGLLAYTLWVGLTVFFEFGGPMVAIGTIIQAQDLILTERQNGLMEWLLSKPVTRRAYILAKIGANMPSLWLLMIGLPAGVLYGMLSLRIGEAFSVGPFLAAIGIITVHMLFYFTLTLMLGTIFNQRAAILGIALGSVLGGGLLGNLIQPLYYVTPWMLPKIAWMTITGQMIPSGLGIAPLATSLLWIFVFTGVAIAKFEKIEF